MKSIKFLLGLSLSVLFGLNPTSLKAQSVSYIPDSSFDSNGLKNFVFFNNIDRLFDCAVYPDGRVIAVGLSKNPGSGYFELCFVRLLENGDPDTSFSGDGNALVSMGSQQSIGGMTPKLKIDDVGRIVAVNSGAAPGSFGLDMLACRLDSNGVLDPTFGTNGVTFIDMLGSGTQPDLASAFDIAPDGSIWVAGATRTGGSPLDNDFAVVKLTTDGVLDPAFNGTGKKLFNPTAQAEFARGIKVQSDGKIVVGGEAGANMYVFRFDNAGVLDPSFNTTGSIQVVFGIGTDMGALDIDNLGRIVIVGNEVTSSSNVAVARILPTGLFDINFGSNGKYTFNISNAASTVSDMYIQADNRIIVGGSNTIAATAKDFMAARVDTTGVIDITFNTNGYFTQNTVVGAVNELGGGMAVTDSGKIVLSGTVEYSSAINEDVAIIRMRPISVNPSAVQEVSLNEVMRVSPNPFTTELMVVSTQAADAELTDLTGRRIAGFSVVEGINRFAIDNIPAGAYLFRVPGYGAIRLIRP
ncbi:MAG: hypothetical protein LW707_02960 [Sphingobacteriales bacterium]|jgi:uncharacterized delta-60 repeat protein|nr:hypothetical protein [Sphingobacteriales bacterium]